MGLFSALALSDLPASTAQALMPPLAIAQSAQNFATPNYYVAALAGTETWSGTTGTPVNISYNFGTTTENGSLLTASGQAAALSAMQAWANVANVTFMPGDAASDLTFSQKSLAFMGAAGVTFSTSADTSLQHTEVIVDSSYTNFPIGTFNYMIFIHELGHALGLKHPGPYSTGDLGPYLPTAEDNYNSTVMSYTPSDQYNQTHVGPSTPMIYDVAAAQFLYGANTNYHSTNTAYTFDATVQTIAIWDGGGTDAIYAPAPGPGIGATTIDLREGLDYVSHIGGTTAWMAFNAHIENAVGNVGNDTLFGNQYDNQLFGGEGSDYLHGGAGNDAIYGGSSEADSLDSADTLFGGLGNDSMYGNSGNDIMYGGRAEADGDDGNDIMYGGKGADSIYGNSGSDILYGGGAGFDPFDQNDLIYGGKGADTIFGNGGDDTLFGGGSSFDPDDQGDVIYGGAGNDLIFGNGGNDTIVGGPGNDTMHGGAGDDIYQIFASEGSDTILLFDGAGVAGGDVLQLQSNLNGSGIVDLTTLLAHMHIDNGNMVIDLGGGNALTIDGIATLGADDVSFF